MGFRRIGIVPVGVAVLGFSPVLVACGAGFTVGGIRPAWVHPLALPIAAFVIAQGLMEKGVYRVWAFDRLRQARSFAASAALCGLAFGLVHLVNLLGGTSSGALRAVGTSIALGFALSLPARRAR